MRVDAMVKSKLRKKRERGISVPLTIAMIAFLIIATSASISGFEWMRNFCLSNAYIKGITVKGNQRVSLKDILGASRLRLGIDSTYSIMPHVVEKYIRAGSPYLEQVSVQHRFVRENKVGVCSWVTIEIVEREPIAFVRFEGDSNSLMIIDAQGFALEKVQAGSEADCLPVIIGVGKEALRDETQDSLGVGNTLTSPALDLALGVLTMARAEVPEMLNEIACIDARNPDSIILLLRESEKARDGEREAKSKLKALIASDRIKEGLNNILPVIIERRRKNRETRYIDARFPGTVYCGEEMNYEGGWKSG